MKWKNTQPARRPTPPWGWAVAGLLLGTLASLLCFAPARWLSAALAEASQQRVQLRDAQGTLWQGSAQLSLGAGAGTQDRARLPGRIQWRIRPSLQGATLVLTSDCCLEGDWTWQWSPRIAGWSARSSDLASPLRLPSALLAGLGTPWNTLQPQGTLALTTQALSLQQQAGRWDIQGAATLDALQMSTSLSTLKPVGSYRLALAGGATPALQLQTLDGSLKLQGQGAWIGGRLRFDGSAEAAPERAEALANLLNIIGRREGARSIIKVG